MDNFFKHFMYKTLKFVGSILLLTMVLLSIWFIRKKEVTIDYLGHKYKVTTVANTVRSLINYKNIYIDDTYTVSPSLDELLKENSKIKITKNEQLAYIDLRNMSEVEYVKIEESKEQIDYTVEKLESDKLFVGQKKIVQKGVNGEKVLVSKVTYKGDKAINKETLYEHIVEPVNERIEVGTRDTYNVSRGQGIPADASDLELLAMLIKAEAGGESYLGQVAVGAVCINRVKSGRFGPNLRAVINANQFCAVRKGMLKKVSPGSPSYRAAEEAISGVDPTNGALYFYNPKYAKSPWSRSRPITAVIGNHNFTT